MLSMVLPQTPAWGEAGCTLNNQIPHTAKPRYSGDIRRITKTATLLDVTVHDVSSGYQMRKARKRHTPDKTIIRSELFNAKSNLTP